MQGQSQSTRLGQSQWMRQGQSQFDRDPETEREGNCFSLLFLFNKLLVKSKYNVSVINARDSDKMAYGEKATFHSGDVACMQTNARKLQKIANSTLQ